MGVWHQRHLTATVFGTSNPPTLILNPSPGCHLPQKRQGSSIKNKPAANKKPRLYLSPSATGGFWLLHALAPGLYSELETIFFVFAEGPLSWAWRLEAGAHSSEAGSWWLEVGNRQSSVDSSCTHTILERLQLIIYCFRLAFKLFTKLIEYIFPHRFHV